MKTHAFLTLLLLCGLSALTFSGCQKEDVVTITESAPDANTTRFFDELPADLKQSLADASRSAEGNSAASILGSPSTKEPNLRGALSYYKIQMSGSTFNGQYPFSRSACLILSPTIKAAGGVNFNNGQNNADIGLFSGNPTLGQAGAIWYTSNTAMCSYGNTGCRTGASALDLVTTTWDAKNRIFTIRPDGRFFGNAAAGNSLVGMLNIFNARSSVTAQIYRVISGEMVIQFSADFKTVAGVIKFNGTSFFGGGGAVPYQAKFSGALTSYCNQ